MRWPLALIVCAGLALPAPAAAAPTSRSADILRRLHVQEAWKETRGDGATVAVLDSGVDADHRDLSGVVAATKDFTEGANPPGVEPRRLHGTYMASLIAGQGRGTGGGVVGVAPKAKILSARVILENDEEGFNYFNGNHRYEDVVAKGIRYAVDEGAEVINLSLSRAEPTKEERNAIAFAISRGVVVVAAAGNDGDSRFSYPASFPGVISVAALGKNHERAGFSNHNAGVTIAAPGVDVLGAGPRNQYWVGEGTSQASALVAGVAALIKAEYPELAPSLVARAIASGAENRPSKGFDSSVGFGEVNAAAAVKNARKMAGHSLVARPGRDDDKPLAAATPIQVVRRDTGHLVMYGGAAGLCAIGLLAVIFGVAAALRRTSRVRGDSDL